MLVVRPLFYEKYYFTWLKTIFDVTQNVHVHLLDMSSPSAVYRFVENFIAEHTKLDVLVNNAGCMVNELTTVNEGNLETNFATNTIGTYILTTQLLPLLKKSEKPRVVIVAVKSVSDLPYYFLICFPGNIYKLSSVFVRVTSRKFL